MSVEKILYFKHLFLSTLFLFLFFNTYNGSQYTLGHFFGTTKNIGDYQLIFAPYYLVPALVVIAVIVVFLKRKNKI